MYKVSKKFNKSEMLGIVKCFCRQKRIKISDDGNGGMSSGHGRKTYTTNSQRQKDYDKSNHDDVNRKGDMRKFRFLKWLFCSKVRQLNDPARDNYHSTYTVREECESNMKKNRKNILAKDNEGFKIESINSTNSATLFKARLTKIYRGRIVTYDIDIDDDVIGSDVEEWCENVIENEYLSCHHKNLYDSHREITTNIYACADCINDNFRLSNEEEKEAAWKRGLQDEMNYTYIIVCT